MGNGSEGGMEMEIDLRFLGCDQLGSSLSFLTLSDYLIVDVGVKEGGRIDCRKGNL